MQYSINDFFLVLFQELIIERLEDYNKKYHTIPMVQKILSGLNHQFKEEILMHSMYEYWFMSGPYLKYLQTKHLDLKGKKEKYLSELDQVKNQLDATDYYMIKSFFTDDENDDKHYLQMARMLHPEDFFSYFLARVKYDSVFVEDMMMDIVKNWPRVNFDRKTRKFFDVAQLVSDFTEDPEIVPLKRIQELISSNRLFKGLIFDLIRRTMNMENSKYMLRILDILDDNSCPNTELDIIKCRLWYNTGNHLKALQLMETIDIDESELSMYFQQDAFNLKAKIYKACGQKGKALLLWRSIANDEDLMNSFAIPYFEANIELATLYIETGQAGLAQKTLMLDGATTRIKWLIEHFEAEYYMLRGEICLSENRPDHAIRMFRNSLKVKENPDIRKKIEMLEKGLDPLYITFEIE